MRETPKAAQAWNDYLELGPGRSLEKLLEIYRVGTKRAPVKKLRTLKEWSRVFGWQQRLADITEQERLAIVKQGIANKQNRIDALNRRESLMWQVIDERAADETLQEIAGGKTGLIVRDVKGVGKGEDFQLIDVYAVDTGLLKEMREHEKQAAQETGDWSEKREVTGADGGPIEITDARERLASRLASLAARGGATNDASRPDDSGSGEPA